MSFGPAGLPSLMNTTVDVERRTGSTASTSGFVSKDWETIHSDAPCRIQAYKGERIADFQRLGMKITHRIHFVPPLDDIKENDRIVHTGSMGAKTYYSVKSNFNPDLMDWFTVVDAEVVKT